MTFFARRFVVFLLLMAAFVSVPAKSWSQEQNYQDSVEIVAPPEETDEADTTFMAEADTSIVDLEPVIRNIPVDSVRLMKSQPGFAYMTFLDSLLRANQRAREKVPTSTNTSKPDPVRLPSFDISSFVKLLCYLAAIGLVGYVLFKLFLGPGIFVRSRSRSSPSIQVELDSQETDLEKALRLAVSGSDYRQASRYLFLITLNKLGEKGILQLSSEKTNYQYISELSGRPYAEQFARLSLQYEYVWFGNFNLNAAQYKEMEQQHQQFLKGI